MECNHTHTTSSTSIPAIVGAAILAIGAHLLSGCGVATPGGYVLGTTGFLEEANRGRRAVSAVRGSELELHTEGDRAELARTIAERGGR